MTIDNLWVQSNNGRFGFSVQNQIYQSLGGKRNYDEVIWEAFGDKVKWREKGSWLYYRDITFDQQAPIGHLPLMRDLSIFHTRKGLAGSGMLGCCLLSRVGNLSSQA
jgi:hypothetical protein